MRTTALTCGLALALGLAGCAGWHDGDHGGGWGRHDGVAGCTRWSGRHLDRALARAEDRLDLDAEQRPAWERLAADVRGAVADACAAAGPGDEPKDALAAFARIERVASAGAAGLERIRPAFEAFYSGLDEEQRRDLDRLLTRRRFG